MKTADLIPASVFYGLSDMINDDYDSFILNGFTPEQARSNAIAEMQNTVSAFSRHWEDAKVNEQIQKESIAAAAAPCVLPPYSDIQAANVRSEKEYTYPPEGF